MNPTGLFWRAHVPHQVEGFGRGRPGARARGQREVPPDRDQVLRGAAHLAHLESGRRRRRLEAPKQRKQIFISILSPPSHLRQVGGSLNRILALFEAVLAKSKVAAGFNQWTSPDDSQKC